MGNQDNWTTPKQLKIEREGEPRGIRRGRLKKGERKKGVKARRDELLSSKQTLIRYAGYITRDRQTRLDHPEWYSHPHAYNFHWETHFDEQMKKHCKLIEAALRDNVIEGFEHWLVEKP